MRASRVVPIIAALVIVAALSWPDTARAQAAGYQGQEVEGEAPQPPAPPPPNRQALRALKLMFEPGRRANRVDRR